MQFARTESVESGRTSPPDDLFAGAERSAEVNRVAAGCRLAVTAAAHDGFITAGTRNEIAGQTDQLIIFKNQTDAFLLAGIVSGLHAVQVIPAIGFESVLQQRGTHDE